MSGANTGSGLLTDDQEAAIDAAIDAAIPHYSQVWHSNSTLVSLNIVGAENLIQFLGLIATILKSHGLIFNTAAVTTAPNYVTVMEGCEVDSLAGVVARNCKPV